MREWLEGGILGGWLLATSIIVAAPPPTPGTITDEVPGAGGGLMKVRHSFDVNALTAAIATDSQLVSITAAGVVVVHDPQTFALRLQRRYHAPVTCLSEEGGSIVAGLEDGSILRLDSATLDATPVGRVQGKPLWVGRYLAPDGPHAIVVTRRGSTDPFGEPPPSAWWTDLTNQRSGRLAALESYFGKGVPPSVFHVDRRQRLWLGVDRGEWGGALAMLDLATGAESSWGEVPAGVYGVTELTDGTILVHGGLTHLGGTSGYVGKVGETEVEVLASYEGPRRGQPRPSPPTAPTYPIVRIFEEPEGLLLLSYGELHRVSRDFSKSEFLGEIETRYAWGRSNALGALPAIRAAWRLGAADELRFRLATIRDGWLEWTPDSTRRGRVPHQLEIAPLRVVSSHEGVILDTWSGGAFPQVRSRFGWKFLELAPAGLELGVEQWRDHRLFVSDAGQLFGALRTGRTPGHFAWLEWKAGSPELVRHEKQSLVSIAELFMTGDGRLWSTTPLISYLEGAGWLRTELWFEPGLEPRVMGRLGKAWLLHTRRNRTLHSLSVVGDQVSHRPYLWTGSDGSPVFIDDGLRDGEGFLLVTSDGLRRLEPDSEELSPSSTPATPDALQRSMRAGDGRLWGMSATAVYRQSADGGSWETIVVPGITEIRDLGPDPRNPHAAWIALGRQGSLWVDPGSVKE